MIYLDNSATSFPKPRSVIKAVKESITKYGGNPGRSSHKMALLASEKILDTRLLIAEFFNYKKAQNIVFTQNATYALNTMIKAVIREKCHVIISDSEHNAVLRPLMKLKETLGVEISVFDSNHIEHSIEELIREDTRAIISTLKSNVTGIEIPLSVLSKISKKHNLILITDASQLAGHKKIDLTKDPCDFLCAPGHKGLFGIQGCGFSIINNEKICETLVEGGSGSNSLSSEMPVYLPDRYEAGTLPTPSIIGLKSGIEFIQEYKIESIEKKLIGLTDFFIDTLSDIKNIKLYSEGCGIISFSLDDIPSSLVADGLNSFNIYSRSGLHCAPMVHNRLGTTKKGLVRVSFSIFNKYSEAEKLRSALIDIKNRY